MDPTLLPIPPDLQTRLQACTSLPSPPKVAIQIIELIKDPDLEIEQVIRTLSMDPALSIKILRMANSAHYAYQHKVNKIEKAVMIMGLNGVLSLALSFSLATALQNQKVKGLNYQWYWLRALIAGSACRTLGELCNRRDPDELFTAAFLQDIGMLVLDQIDPTLYVDLDIQHISHRQILAHEQSQLGTTHAAIGSWLLAQWSFPDTLRLAVHYSDVPNSTSAQSEHALFFKFISIAGDIADLYLTKAGDEEFLYVSDRLEEDLGRGSLALPEILRMIEGLVNANATLFEIDCDSDFPADRIYEQARELLVDRNIRSTQPIDVLATNMNTLKSI